MNARTLFILVIAAAAALLAGYWLADDSGNDAASMALLPGLEEAVNNVSAIGIYAEPDTPAVTIERGEDAWQVVQKGNYPADIGRVRSLLLALAEARRIEPKTSNPDYYERLGVQALGSGENFRIKLGGVDVPGLLVGDSVPGRGAFYARLDGMAASWLASGTVDVPLDPQQWLDTDLLDIAAARIADITISHPDDSSLTVARPVFGGDLVLEEKPEARELARANILDDVAGSLATLTLTDVQRRDTLELPSDPVRVRARTVDGLVIDATLYAVDDRRYLALETGVDESVASRFRPTADDDDPENETGETDLPPPDMSEVEREATQLNERLAGWIFSIGTARYDQLTRRLEDLLAAVEPD